MLLASRKSFPNPQKKGCAASTARHSVGLQGCCCRYAFVMDDRYQKWRTSNTQKKKTNKPTETQTTNHPALERSRTTLLRFVCSRNEEKCVPAAWRSYFLNQKFMTTGHLSHRHTQLITRFRQRHRRPQYDRTLNIGSARYDLPCRPQYTTRRRPQELRRWDGKMTPFSHHRFTTVPSRCGYKEQRLPEKRMLSLRVCTCCVSV